MTQDQTLLHPLGLVFFAILAIATLLAPRRYALLPMLLMACFISPAQKLAIGGLDFNMLRLLVIVGWTRLLMRHELRPIRWTAIDLLVISVPVVSAVAYISLWQSSQAAIFQSGQLFDAVGMYFLFRHLLASLADVRALATSFVIVSVPFAAVVSVELFTGRNMFSVFGGVPEMTLVRGGRRRCQGAFPHAIMMGSFWAIALPLMASLWWWDKRKLAMVGVLAGLFCVFASASSTPAMGVIFAAFAAGFFPFRHRLRAIRWGFAASLILLHFVMKGPVWSLLAKANLFSGSTGWHRFHLLDKGIRNVSEWALNGTQSTAHWGYGLSDVTNQYLAVGVEGGIVALALFIALLAFCYRAAGMAMKAWEPSRPALITAYCLGVILFTHTMMFFAVSYFGQMIMLWTLTVALSATFQNLATQSVAARAPRRRRAAAVRARRAAGSRALPGATA